MKYLILALAATLTAQAQAELKTAEAFAGVTLNKSACFTREYSKRHMASRPRQTVERIKIKLKQTQYENFEPMNVLAIQVKRKNDSRLWTNNIACFDDEKNKTVRCSVECDGGSVEILERNADGKMLLKNNGVVLYGGCGDEGANGEEPKTIFLKSRRGGDDVFLLQQAEEQACADVSDEAH